MIERLDKLARALRARRSAALAVVLLRLLLGFAMLPAGLKKVLGEPFTDPDKTGPFHELLHAFHATGAFYTFVGACQLGAATLLLTQRYATLGALLYLPLVTAIGVFCWATRVIPTATVVTLMWLGTLVLVLWDLPKLRRALASDARAHEAGAPLPPPQVDPKPWERCGLAILIVYLAATAVAGSVYRPRGFEPHEPSFWMLVAIALMPLAAWRYERRRS